jgi:hypothetical protein
VNSAFTADCPARRISSFTVGCETARPCPPKTERHHQLVDCRNGAVREDRCSLRVQAARHVIANKFQDGRADSTRTIAVSDHLIVGDHDKNVVTRSLQPYPIGERAEIVTEVLRTRRPVTGEYSSRRHVSSLTWLDAGSGHGEMAVPTKDGRERWIVQRDVPSYTDGHHWTLR